MADSGMNVYFAHTAKHPNMIDKHSNRASNEGGGTHVSVTKGCDCCRAPFLSDADGDGFAIDCKGEGSVVVVVVVAVVAEHISFRCNPVNTENTTERSCGFRVRVVGIRIRRGSVFLFRSQ